MVAGSDSTAGEREAVATIPQVLAESARRDPGGTFLVDGGSEYSFGAIAERVERTRRRLVELGIGSGDRVALWLPNGLGWVRAFFAALKLGAIVVPTGTRLRTADVEHVLADSESRALIFAPRFLGIDFDAMVGELVRIRERGGLPALEHVIATDASSVPVAVDLEADGDDGDDDEAKDASGPQADDLAVACYTSGTTGRPKGCLHTHRALVRNARVAAHLSGLAPGERVACPVPFTHVFGFHMGVLQTALAGATLINAEPYDPDDYLDLCAERRATVAYEVPTMARETVAAQARSPRELELRLALIAGAPVSAALRSAVIGPKGIAERLSVAYGCTEAPTISQLVPSDPPQAQTESVGQPTPGVKVLIAGPGTVEGMPPGEVGEILVRGYNTMHAYLGDPEATERKFRDGWLVTGDLGALDANGFLHFAGRADDTLLVGGFNAYPREIEARLEQLAGVDEVAVIGVPDERLGEVPMAWVAAEPGALDDGDVLAWAKRNLPSYKRPRHVRVVPRLPRVGSGKVARARLLDAARRELVELAWPKAAR